MPKRRPLHARLWEKVEVRGGDACWEWRGSANPNGYGMLGDGTTRPLHGRAGLIHAHRAAWLVAVGPIPDGLCVLHRCDNPPCCRPDHLFLGTMSDNTQDMMAKGRHNWSKITPIQREAMLAEYLRGTPARALSDRYGVGAGYIYSLASQHRHQSTVS